MNREIAKEDDDNSATYDATKYDKVFIVMKDNADNKKFSECMHFSIKRQRHYLLGRLVKLEVPHWDGKGVIKYPLNGSVAFVDEKQVEEYKRLNHPRKKVDYIYNVFYGDIDYIVLDFNAFDWKKYI